MGGVSVIHSASEVPAGFVQICELIRSHGLQREDRESIRRGRKAGKIGEFKLISKWHSNRRNYATFVDEAAALEYLAAAKQRAAEVVVEEVAALAPEPHIALPSVSQEVTLLRAEVERLRGVVSELVGLKKATEDMVAAVSLLAERGLTL